MFSIKKPSVYNLKTLKENEFKKYGKYHTPTELAEYMKSFLPDNVTEVYDPTVGYGSLLRVFDDNVIKYGQDIDEKGIEVCKEELTNFHGVAADVLLNPAFMDKKFKAIMANPPYSVKYQPEKVENDIRFKELPAMAPRSKADLMFLQHINYMLADGGVAVCLMFPGVAYRQHAERKIRGYLIEQKLIAHVENIHATDYKFVDTSIDTLLIVLKRGSEKIKFVDGKYSKEVDIAEVRENDYNLSVSTYVEKPDPRKEEMANFDPIATELEARKMLIAAIDRRINFSKACIDAHEFLGGGYFPPIIDFINDIQAVLDRHKKELATEAASQNQK